MERRRIDGLLPLLQATILTLVVTGGYAVSTASAIDFDRRGRASLNAAYAQGFEDQLESNEYFGDRPDYTSEKALQGERSMIVGDGRSSVYLTPPGSSFEGRRVNVRLWYNAEGTDVSPRLFWANRSLQQHGNDGLIPLGSAPLHPTGRATSDGWIELETGPIDWEFGPAGGPAALVLEDTQYTLRSPFGPDSSLEVLIDAVEIEDLGEAAVPSSSCTLGNEDQKCGAKGVCMLGRCVDAAAALGSLPTGEMREQYLARRSFLIDTTLAIRRTRSNLSEFDSTLSALKGAPEKEAWGELVDAWELLRDGHSSPPSNRALRIRNQGGVCLGPGEADLIENGPSAPVPMVFEAPNSDRLERGDVVTSIDGMPVDKWREEASRYLYYNGDPAGRAALQVNEVFKAAILAGSEVEFERCARSSSNVGEPCGTGETETVTIDFGEGVGTPVYNGEAVDGFFRRRGFCDFRFDGLRPEGERVQGGAAYFNETQDGIVRAEYYNMPQARRGGGALQSWAEGWQNALSDNPSQVVVDQRLGFGGGFTATHFLGNIFLKDATDVIEVGLPWYGTQLTDEMLDGLVQCQAQGGRDRGCGGLFANRIQSGETRDIAADSRLALVTADAVSGHDFWAKYMTFRTAETRVFGYAPTKGAFGAVRRFPTMKGELQGPSYQFHDTRFTDDAENLTAGDFSSGKGVQPDVTVYQAQSDALAGTDTIVEAAKAWLRNSGSNSN